MSLKPNKSGATLILRTDSFPATSKTIKTTVSFKSNEFDKLTKKMPLVRAFWKLGLSKIFAEVQISLCKIRRETRWRRHRTTVPELCSNFVKKMRHRTTTKWCHLNLEDGFEFGDLENLHEGRFLLVLFYLSWFLMISDGSLRSEWVLFHLSWSFLF